MAFGTYNPFKKESKVVTKLPQTKGQYTPGQGSAGKPPAKGNPAAPPPRQPTQSKPVYVGGFVPGGGGVTNQPRQPGQPVPSPKVVAGSGDPRNIGGLSAVNPQTAASAYQGSGSSPLVGGPISTPATGFAAQVGYRPEAIQSLLAQPELILADLMSQRGMSPNGAGAGLMALGTPYMDALNAVMPLAFGGGLPNTPWSPINWLAQMGQQAITPGGAAIDFHDVMRQLGGLAPGSATYDSLYGTGMSPLDQVNATKQIVYGAAQAGLPEFFQRAVQNQMNAAALDFLRGQYGKAAPAAFAGSLPNFWGR